MMAAPTTPSTGRFRALARRLGRAEHGSALVEVMVSAMVVAILAVGVLAGFDAAGATSGTNKARGIAASLAQEDQERIRGMQASDVLKNGGGTRTVTVGGVDYRVESTIRPVDSGGSGCGDGSLLRLASSVTWPGMRGLAPVKADSLLTPRAGSFAAGEGGLIGTLTDRNGDPLPGVQVSISGPRSASDATDENGCASFLFFPVGDYSLSFARPGYVTPDGTVSVSKTVSVPDGAVSTAEFQYDRAAQVSGSVETLPAWLSTPVADPSDSLAVSHPSLPAPGARFFAASPARSSISSSQTLFPFTSSYSVFSGRCAGANPTSFGAAPASVTLLPGGAGSVTVREPALNMTVLRGASPGTPFQGARVRIVDKTCGAVIDLSNATDAAGHLSSPGLPYGDYDVCVDDGTSQATRTNVQNGQPQGTSSFSLLIPTSGGTRRPCP